MPYYGTPYMLYGCQMYPPLASDGVSYIYQACCPSTTCPESGVEIGALGDKIATAICGYRGTNSPKVTAFYFLSCWGVPGKSWQQYWGCVN